MTGQHADQTTIVDSPSRSNTWFLRDSRSYPGQPLLGIGTEVTVHTVVEVSPGLGTYVPTEQPGYVVAVEDIPDGVYEIWQPCTDHGGVHKFYAQYESDVMEGEKPDLYFLAMVIDD